MELILELCNLYSSVAAEVAHKDPGSLLHDFILHIVMGLGSSYSLSYSTGQTNSLHVLGLLLDSYCQYDSVMPPAIRSYPDFLSNLIAGLKLPGYESNMSGIKCEVNHFLLYKISSFEEGIKQLLPFLPDLMNAGINALVKTENDELRMNCIALLSSMAQQSLISIRFQQTNVDDLPEHCNEFARDFAVALEGSLISSDSQVQILIEEDIMDYLFEILRVCENTPDVLVWSTRNLRMLSEATDAFTQRFTLGLDTVNWIPDHSTETSMHALQSDLLILIDLCLRNYPGAISRVSAERLLHIMTAIIKNYTGDSLGLEQEAFNSSCSSYLHCRGSYACPAWRTMCRHAVLLLKRAFLFSLKAHEPVECSFADNLILLVEKVLLPRFLKNLAVVDDEDTVFAILEVLFLMLDGPSLLSCIKLGDSLATASWFGVTYELMARFPGCRMKDLIINVLGSMICRLERGTLEENVKQQFTQLPSDPQDLLVLLALSSIHDLQLKFIQFAVIKILYFSHIYMDRFTEESHVLACLEQYLLMNFSALSRGSCSSCIIKIHICTKETANLGSLTHSLEVESLLASLLEQCPHTIISSNMHRSVFTWLTRTQSLDSFMIASILEWIKTYEGGERVSNEKFATYPRVVNQEGQPENLNFFLVALEEEDCCASALVANQLCLSGIVSNIRSWLAIYGARLPRIQGCLFELLYQLLCAVDHDRALDEESWGFLVNQFVHPLADSLNCLDDAAHKEGLLSLLSLMGLILHKSTENTGFLTQASGVILSHEQLQNSIKSCLVNFGAQGCKLSDLVGESSDGKSLACALAFQFICLRCAIDTLRPTCHTAGLTHASVLSLKEDSLLILDTCYDLVLPRSIEQVEPLRRLLYFGSSFGKPLSSSVLAEAFSWLTHPGKSQSYSESFRYKERPSSVAVNFNGFDDGNSSGSEHSLDEEFGIPSVKTPGVKKALQGIHEKLRRSGRHKNPVDRLTYDSYVARHCAYMAKIVQDKEHTCFDEAIGNMKWEQAMDEEMAALDVNETWKLVPLPDGKKSIGCKWVYKVKHNADGSISRYKATLVAKGYAQTYGIDYEETFSPVAKMAIVHTVIAVAASKGWLLHQMDVKNAFLHGDLQEEVYMEQPQGYEEHPSYVCKLKKALYGLKQAPRAWHARIVAYLVAIGFHMADADHSLYVRKNENAIVIVCIYVDDLIIGGDNEGEIMHVKSLLKKEFDMKDLGELQCFLGIEIIHTEEGI
ncbi:hypothetical protein L7F22_047039 [Adiantum nelumboides]|nr:hypothetical protein [Adiantum nelumboides]